MATVRYIVDDVAASIDFYCRHLGFELLLHPAPTFAMLRRGDLRLALSAPGSEGGGGRALPAGVHFRSDLVIGVGGNQVVLDDPSGNPVELFQPTRPEARAEPG